MVPKIDGIDDNDVFEEKSLQAENLIIKESERMTASTEV